MASLKEADITKMGALYKFYNIYCFLKHPNQSLSAEELEHRTPYDLEKAKHEQII